MPQHVAILGTRYPDFSIEEHILGPLGVEIVAADGADETQIVDVAGTASVILAGSRPRFTANVLNRLSCRGIVRYGVGVDSVDVGAAKRLGIAVASVPDYGTEAVATHTAALILAALRKVPSADRHLKSGEWGFAHLRPLHLPSELTAGVVGVGRIGQAVVGILKALGFGVVAFDPLASGQDVEMTASLEALLAVSDVVTLHAPGSADGTPLLDRRAIRQLRPGSIVVNTARGTLVDLEALIEGLQVGRPTVAALDVFPNEPPQVDRFAQVADNVILTPHMAWYTEESQLDLRRKAAEEAARLLRGEDLRHPVQGGNE